MSISYLNNKFNGEYLDRYRKGELSAQEAHELEKASLEDPLLAEAMEGFYSSSRSSEHELNFLKSWVSDRVEESQASIRFIPKRRSFAPLMRVAAVFLLVIGASWMGYIFWMDRTQPLLADAGTGDLPTNQSAPVRESGASRPIQTDLSSMPPSVPIEKGGVVATVDQVKEEPKKAVDSPPVADKEQPVVAVQQADVVSVAPAQPEQEVMADKATRNLAEARQAEAVVRTNTAKQLAADGFKTVDSPTPAVGWTSFESYLERNSQSAPTPSNTLTAHLVELSFEVGKDGRPTDIKVERSAGSFYDDKAIELLKKGPGWIPGKSGKRAELQVRF
ncbi:MAG: hypothetical protein RL750_373 [Bacteroidota bacterium]